MIAFVTICVVLVAFGVIAAIAAAVERLPSCPPMYDYADSDVLPDPEWRARVPRVDPDREWIVE